MMYSAHIIGESFSSSSFYENLLALLSPYKDEMSDSENSSLLEEKNKDAVPGQEDSPKLESIDMTLGTGTAPKNATDPSKGLREDSKETTAASPSSERQTKKSILQSDLESIEKVTGSIKKSTNTAGDQPVESPSRHARKPSYSKKGGRTERYSKKEKPKTNTFKQVSEDECTVQTSDRGSASAAEKRTKSKSDASKPSFVDTSIKSIDEQALSSGRNVSIESPTKKKSDMSRSTKPDSVQRRSHPTMEPRKTAENSRSFSSPSRSAQPSPKKIAKSFQTLSSPSLVAQIEKLLPPSRKIAQRSQTLSPPSRTAQQSPKKIAESSQTFSPPARTAQTSRKIAELSRIFLSPSEFASRKSSKISRTLSFPSRSGQPSTRKQNRSLPQEESVSFQLDPVDNGKENTRTSNVRESEKPTSATSNKGTESSNRVGHSPGRYYAAPLPLKSVKSIIKKFEGMRLLVDKTTEAGGNERRPEKLEDKQKRTTATRTSPAKVPSNSKTRISPPNESTSPAKVPSSSKARTSSPNKSTSPAKVPSSSKARTSSPNKSTSPAKVPSSSKARTSPKRQPENVTIQSDVENITVTASGAQSTTRGGAIPKTSTQQILKNREIRKDYSNEQASYSERRSEQVDLHMKKYGRINRWIPLDFIPPSSDTSEDVPKEPMRIFLPPHKSEAKANAPHETSTSSVETPENVDNTRLEAEKEMGTVSEAQSSVAHGGARPKIRAEETSKSKKSRKERRNFKDALDVLDYISSKGMSNLEPLLQEAEKKCSKTYPRSDWIDTTEDAETNEIVTLEELHKILEEEFEKREKEKVKTDPWVPIATSSSENSPEDGLIDAAAAFVEQPPHVESESSSSGQQAVDVKRFEIVDLPIQEMSADALFDALHEIKLQHGPEPWLELLKIFFRTGRFHASGELETVRRRMYDSDVMRQFYELYWTHYREMRHRAIDTGYSEEPEYNFRRLRRITSRIEKMTLAMLWLDVNERLIETHEDQMQRMEEDMAQRGARGHFPLPGGDSPSESSSSSDLVEQEESRSDGDLVEQEESRSDGDLVEQERSRSSSDSVEQEESGRSSSNSGDLSAQKYSKRPSISYQQLHERVKHDERKNKPKPIDRFRRKVTGSRPPSRLDSSDDSSVEGRFTPPHFNQICKENSLLKELMLRKGRRSSSHENISHNDPNSGCAMIPLHHLPSDTVKRSSSTNSLLSRDSSESVSVEATPKTASSSSPGSGGDLLSKHTRSEETDSSGDSKHFAAVDLEPEHSFANVSPLPLDPEETELEKVLDDMFVDMVHFVREKEDPEKQ